MKPFDLNAFLALLLGAGGVASLKAARDVIRYFRAGRAMKEQTLVTSLTTALERLDAENVSLQDELEAMTKERNFYRNEMGKREYLLEKNHIEYEAVDIHGIARSKDDP